MPFPNHSVWTYEVRPEALQCRVYKCRLCLDRLRTEILSRFFDYTERTKLTDAITVCFGAFYTRTQSNHEHDGPDEWNGEAGESVETQKREGYSVVYLKRYVREKYIIVSFSCSGWLKSRSVICVSNSFHSADCRQVDLYVLGTVQYWSSRDQAHRSNQYTEIGYWMLSNSVLNGIQWIACWISRTIERHWEAIEKHWKASRKGTRNLCIMAMITV